MRRRSFVALPLVVIAACDPGSAAIRPPGPRAAPRPSREPAPVSPPVITWHGLTATIVVAEPAWRRVHATMKARVALGSGDAVLVLRLEVTDLPAGSSLAAGAMTVPAAHGVATAEIPIPDLGAISITALERPVELALGMPIEITLPDQAPVSTAVPSAPLDLRLPLMDAFEWAAERPVGLASAANSFDTAALVGQSIIHQRVGSGTTLGDIDWIVAIARQPTERRKACSGYQRVGTITVRFVDQLLTIYDARTGAVVATDVMAPAARCPRFAMVRDQEASESVSTDDIKRRVAQLLARGSARRAR